MSQVESSPRLCSVLVALVSGICARLDWDQSISGVVLLVCPHVCTIWRAHHHQANKIVCCSGPSCFHAVFVRTADKTPNANQDVCLVVQGITCAVFSVLQ